MIPGFFTLIIGKSSTKTGLFGQKYELPEKKKGQKTIKNRVS
jgi:hypothetical protein